VALPHARLPGLTKPLVAFGLSRSGIHDPESGKTIRLMVLLLSPAETPEIHVQALCEISRLVRDDAFRKSAFQTDKPEDLHRLIIKRISEI
jgi:mannitol/fructose-specific phosphotransferase system IIA component (Ntr-type)